MFKSSKRKTRPDDRQKYWANRADALIYSYTVSMARKYCPKAESAIDVGCFVSPIICELDWIEKRFANDVNPIPEWNDVAGVEFIKSDFKKIDIQKLTGKPKFDLVISHQTIEHIDDAQGFAQALCTAGNRVICSTSFEVKAGLVPGHVQDPIDLEKFESWFHPRRARSILIERMDDPRFASILGVF